MVVISLYNYQGYKSFLLQPVQCGIFSCSCVYVDTGNVNNEIDVSNRTTREELLPICPVATEDTVDGCIQPPIDYPCNLTQIKYVK